MRNEPRKDVSLGDNRPAARMKQIGMNMRAKTKNSLIRREEASLNVGMVERLLLYEIFNR